MSQNVAGTFLSAQSVNVGQISDTLVIPTSVVSMRLNLAGLDASNTVKTQKSVNSGQAWTDQVTYNSAQTNTAVTVVAGEHWRILVVTQQAGKQMTYSMSVES
jgi:hypothetical protein